MLSTFVGVALNLRQYSSEVNMCVLMFSVCWILMCWRHVNWCRESLAVSRTLNNLHIALKLN